MRWVGVGIEQSFDEEEHQKECQDDNEKESPIVIVPVKTLKAQLSLSSCLEIGLNFVMSSSRSLNLFPILIEESLSVYCRDVEAQGEAIQKKQEY